MRFAKILVTLLVLGAAGYGWWVMTRMDRIVRVTTKNGFRFDKDRDDDERYVIAHAKDPRAVIIAKAERKDTFSFCGPTDRRELGVKTLDAVFSAQPLDGSDDSADTAARGLMRCIEPNAKSWAKIDDAALARAVRAVIHDGSKYLRDADAGIAWLEERRVPVNEDVIVAMGLALGQSKRAERHFALGFPPDGQKLVPASEQAERVPPVSDPRIANALTQAILSWNTWERPNEAVPILHAQLANIRLTPTNDLMLALIRLSGLPSGLDVVTDVLFASDLPKLRELAHDEWQTARLAVIAARLGGSEATDVQKLLDGVQDYMETHPHASDAERAEKVRGTAYTLKELGAPAIPVVTRALNAKTPEVRDCAILALHDLDPTHFADAVGAVADRGGFTPLQLKKAIDLSGDKPDPRLYFGLMATPTWAGDAEKALKARLSPPVIARALLDHLAHGSEFAASEVRAYEQLLGTDEAPTVAAVLEEQLAKAGKPDDVYWLTKIVALRALRDHGTQKERPTVAKFLVDQSRYEDVTTQYRGDKEVDKKSQQQLFSWLAQEALKAIDARK